MPDNKAWIPSHAHTHIHTQLQNGCVASQHVTHTNVHTTGHLSELVFNTSATTFSPACHALTGFPYLVPSSLHSKSVLCHLVHTIAADAELKVSVTRLSAGGHVSQ